MPNRISAPRPHVFLCALAVITLFPHGAYAAHFSTLHSFTGPPGDGARPWSSLVADKAGNLYGTTNLGGSTDQCRGYKPVGCGTVFKLAPDGSDTVLHAFSGQPDGAYPLAGLVADGSGNLYGTTTIGGTANKGAVFRVAPDGTESVLYSFAGKHGEYPEAVLIVDGSGNLYGTTAFGGDPDCPERVEPSGCGVVFKIAPDGTETVLHAFADAAEGNEPLGGLVMDPSGSLYGMTQLGGSGYGNIYEITSDGSEAVLYTFQGMPDGARPAGELIIDGAGNLYGTTGFGGNSCQHAIYGCGTVFKLQPNGNETVLYAFNEGCCDGIVPAAALVADANNDLYGTTLFGGDPACNCGAVFKLAPDNTETVLHAFRCGKGEEPGASLLLLKGDLYGTTFAGNFCGKGQGHRWGSVFELEK
jgi:uncharacterized repeat protein (TIGR03803 family)